MLTKGGVSQIGVIASLILGCLAVGTYGQANKNWVENEDNTAVTTPNRTVTTDEEPDASTNTTIADSSDTDALSTISSAQSTSSPNLTSSSTSRLTLSSLSSTTSTNNHASKTALRTVTIISPIKSSTTSVTPHPPTFTSVSSTASFTPANKRTKNMFSPSASIVSVTSSFMTSTSVSPISSLWTTSGNKSITSNTTILPDHFQFTPGLTIGIVLGLLGLVIIAGFILYHLRKRKKSYRICTMQYCYRCFKFKRLRTSSTGSHGPLTPDDATSVDIPSTNRDRELFSIGDQDGGDDGRPSFSRHDSDDDYFYDEIFDRSAFQDRKTIQSNKHLTLSGDEEVDDFDGDFEVPDLEFKRPFSSRI